MKLAELQHSFMLSCLGDTNVNNMPLSGDVAHRAVRIGVYETNIIETCVASLASTFDTVQELVGEEFFNAMAQRYVREAPPSTGVLYDFGAEFPEFIINFKPAQTLPYLPDTARYDWAWHRAYCEKDQDNAVTPTMVERGGVALAQHVQLLACEYPASDIWAFAHKEQPDPPEPLPGQYYYMLCRDGLDVMRRDVASEFYTLLISLKSGTSIEAAASHVAERYPHCDISQLLTTLFGMNILTPIT